MYNRSRIPQSDPRCKQFSFGAPFPGRSRRTKGGGGPANVRVPTGRKGGSQKASPRRPKTPGGGTRPGQPVPHRLGNGCPKYTGEKRRRTSQREEREREREKERESESGTVPRREERAARSTPAHRRRINADGSTSGSMRGNETLRKGSERDHCSTR